MKSVQNCPFKKLDGIYFCTAVFFQPQQKVCFAVVYLGKSCVISLFTKTLTEIHNPNTMMFIVNSLCTSLPNVNWLLGLMNGFLHTFTLPQMNPFKQLYIHVNSEHTRDKTCSPWTLRMKCTGIYLDLWYKELETTI